jgi:phage-related baseplate assembly protein
MATLEELTTPLTKAEIETAIYDGIAARGVATTSWKPGAIARTIIACVAIVLSAFSTLQARIAESGFLELASGDWLTLVARYVFGVERDEGTFAAGNVQLDNTGGGVFAIGVGDLIVSNSSTGKQYRNTAAFSLAALEEEKIVPVEAIEIGADSTSAAGTIDTIVTTMLNVTVTNPTALVGLDPDTDPELREKCQAKTGTLSPNGPADAYRYIALSAEKDDGSTTGVTRVTTIPDGEGRVYVWVANASGTLTGTVGDTTTDLGAVDAAIQEQCVPLAVTAVVDSAVALTIDVTYQVWVRNTTGFTSEQLEEAIATYLATFMASQPINGSRKVAGQGYVFKQAIEAAIASVVGTTHLIDKSISLPAADVAVDEDEAPVLGTVLGTVTVVSI